MADNSVYITGITDDAFANEIRKLPPWATEQTLNKMSGYLQKSLGLQAQTLAGLNKLSGLGGGGAGLSPAEAKKVNDELEKLGKHLNRRNAEEEKDKRRRKQEADGEKTKITKTEKLNFALGLLATAGSKLTDVYKRSFNVSDSLLQSGINTTAGMEGLTEAGLSLQQAVRLTHLRFETLQKVVEKYSASVNAVGFNKFAKTVGKAGEALSKVGFSNEQQAELVGALIESETAYADIRSKSSDQIAAEAVALGTKMSRLSFVMGVSIEKMNENALAFSKSTDATTVSAIFGEKAAGNMKTFISSFGDNKGAAEIMQKLAATQNPILTKAYQDMAKAGQAGLADSMTRIAQYARDTGDTIGAQRQLEALALRTGASTFKALEVQASAGNEGARASLETLTAFRQNATRMSKATGAEVDQAVKDKGVRSELSSAMEDFGAAADKTFAALNSQISLMTDGVNLFNKSVDWLNNLMNPIAVSWAGIVGIGVGLVASLMLAQKTITMFFSLFGSGGTMLVNTISTVAKTAASAFGPLIALAATAYLAWQAGTSLYENILSKSDTFNKGATETFKGVDSVLSFFGSEDAKHRLKVQADADAMLSSTPIAGTPRKSTEISVPKTPMASTIDSPSAVPAAKTATTSSDGTTTPTTTTAGPNIEKPGRDADINSLLGYQAKIMEQVLQSTNSLLTVNKDILRYTRARA